MMLGLTWEQWALAGTGAFLIGLAKGGLPGVGNVSPLLFASAFAARASVGLVLPVLIAGDICAVLIYRRHADWGYVRRLLPWMLFGVVLGWALFNSLDDHAVKVFIATIILGMTLWQVTAWFFAKRGRDLMAKVPQNPWFSRGMGTLGGLATMIANAAGPIGQVYFLSVGLPKMAFLGTTAWTFFILNVSKIPFSIQLGILDWSSLRYSAVFALFAVAGALVAPLLVRRISEERFRQLIWVFIVVAAIKLLVG